MINIREILSNASLWLEQHWKYVMSLLLCIIVLQQCSLSRMQRQLDTISSFTALAADTTSRKTVSPPPATNDTTSQDSTLATTERQEAPIMPKKESNLPALLAVLALVALGGALIFMKKRAIYPIGLWVGGKLRQTEAGELLISLNIKNRSSKEIEADVPIVTFYLPGGQRKFRANIPEMPITLQPGTSFATEVNITKLIGANMELMQAKAIGISVQCDGKRHGTIPTPVKIAARPA